MRSHRTTFVLFCVLAVLAFAPMMQEHLHFPKVTPLNGVTRPVEFPQFSWKAYQDRELQNNLEKYLQQHHGFRPCIIRLYNQYLWDFYKKTYLKKSVTIGKEGWLYEPWFVEDHYHGGTYKENMDSLSLVKKFDEESLRIYQLQHVLERYGITLFVCQAPGKDLVYPEYLPEDPNPSLKKKVSARDYYEAKFDTMGINHINVEQWFLQMKDTVDFLLFPQKGTHWSNIAAAYVGDSIFRYIEAKQHIKMNRMQIGEPYIGKIRKPDNDLETLFNLSRPQKKLPQHYVDYTVEPDPKAYKPKLLTVGDSYFWNICAYLPMYSILSGMPYWYYNSTIHFDSLHQSTKEVNLMEELLSTDAVMLMYCSTQLYIMSNDFCKQALTALCYDKEEIDTIKANLVETIKNNQQWSAEVERKAAIKNMPLDLAFIEEANDAVNSHPEYFLPALKDSIPVKESPEVRPYIQNKKSKKM